MRRLVLLAALVLGVAAFVAPTAPASTGASVAGHGVLLADGINLWTASVQAGIDHSGNPFGYIKFVDNGFTYFEHVNCVRVHGNQALLSGDLGPAFAGGLDVMLIYVNDLSASGLPDQVGVFFTSPDLVPGSQSHGCRIFPFSLGAGYADPLVSGDFTVQSG